MTARFFRAPFGIHRPSAAARFVGLGASTLVALAGCASAPVAPPAANPLLASPIVAESPPGGPPIVDGRARFRAVFCAELAENPQAAAGRSCDRWLWHMPDEPALPDATTAPASAAGPVANVIVVPGAFSECYGDDTQPYHPHLVQRQDAVPFPTETLLSALIAFVEQDLNGCAEAR